MSGGRTDSVRNGVAGVACLEDEDGGVRVLGETRRKSEPCSAASDDDEVVRARDLAIVDNVSSVQVVVRVLGMDVTMATLPGERGLGERGGQQKQAEGPHRGRRGGGGRKEKIDGV